MLRKSQQHYKEQPKQLHIFKVNQYILYSHEDRWNIGKIIAIEAGDLSDSILVCRFTLSIEDSHRKFVYHQGKA